MHGYSITTVAVLLRTLLFSACSVLHYTPLCGISQQYSHSILSRALTLSVTHLIYTGNNYQPVLTNRNTFWLRIHSNKLWPAKQRNEFQWNLSKEKTLQASTGSSLHAIRRMKKVQRFNEKLIAVLKVQIQSERKVDIVERGNYNPGWDCDPFPFIHQFFLPQGEPLSYVDACFLATLSCAKMPIYYL